MSLQLAPVRQQVSTKQIADVKVEIHKGFDGYGLAARIQPGMKIAIGLGSRGISCLPVVVRTVVDILQSLGAEPFFVPAMGSHGGGTAEGQQAVLESYGFGAGKMGLPIVSSMETVQIGATPAGMPVFFDKHTTQADGIVVINRIKEHTAFKGRWESGLFKMLAVGFGKQRGATEIHNRGVKEAMPAAGRVVLAQMPVLFGVGVVENGQHQPAHIAVLPAEHIESEEPALLDLARRLLPKIPLEPIDLLIVQEMGKNVSGTGLDLNVVGMWRRTGGPVVPQIQTIAVFDLTEESHGNAIGVGHADLITQSLRDKIDLSATYTNCITSHNLVGGKIPITLPTEQAVIQSGLSGIDPAQARVVFIRNTLDLEQLWVSEALLAAVKSTPGLTQLGGLEPLKFTADGKMIVPHGF